MNDVLAELGSVNGVESYVSSSVPAALISHVMVTVSSDIPSSGSFV